MHWSVSEVFVISLFDYYSLYKILSTAYFSGDPHQFEQKFNYRRPMYAILKYMWGEESYRESIKVRTRQTFYYSK